MRKIALVLMVFAVFSIALTACAKPAPSPPLASNEVELKYDDGTSDGKYGIGGPGSGVYVKFVPPTASLKVTKVRISAELVGSRYENRMFDLLIWDKDQTELWSGSFSHTMFESSDWAEIAISDVIVSGNFYVVFIPNAVKDSGVYIHYDSRKNEHSGYVQNWKISDWNLKLPEEKTSWMIRVVGR